MTTINVWCRDAAAGFIFAIAAGVLCTPKLAATTVTSFTPAQGVAGTAVQITGTGFFVPSSVKFAGVNATFSVHNMTSITAWVPATATTGPISVEDPFYGIGISTTNFTIPAPIISSFAPVKVVPYSWINIKGTFLTGASAVTLNGVPPWSWYPYDDGNVWAQVPPTATSGPITVTTPGGSGTSSTNYIRIPGLLANPTFDTDTAAWATTFSITGAWDPLDADGSAGSGSMLFTHAANVYSTEGVVQCTRVSPNLQHRVGGRYLIPAGQPLGSSNEVLVGVIWYSGTACDTGTFISSNSYDQQIYAYAMGTWQTATVAAMSPPNAQSAAVQGKLLTNVLLRAYLDNMFFDVDSPPSIDTLVPPMGVRGAEISLQGSGFYGVTSVTFNTTPATFTIRSANEIRAFVPAAAVDGPIHVSAPAGVADSANFDVILPPVITLNPNAAEPGAKISIHGNDLQHATSVDFNGVPVSFTGFRGSLSVTVPSTATTGLVTVTNPAGSGSASFTLCSYSLSSTASHFAGMGGTSSVTVTGATGCLWNAVSNDAFITITSGSSGNGNGTVNYSVAPNSGSARSGTMTIAGQTFTVNEDAVEATLVGLRGDFNGDGKGDILLRDSNGNIGMWIMNGPTITSGAFVGAPGGSYTIAGIGDFNGDGKSDILLRDSLGNLGMWIMNGPVITSGAFVGSPGGSYTVAAVADFNGDGKADILLRDSLGNLGMWIMNGPVITSGALVGSPGGSYTVAAAADFNGDGKADILLRDSLGNLGMWIMNGPVISSGASVGSPGGSYTVAGAGDFNGDGKADILLRDSLGNLGMWVMNGPVVTSGAFVGAPGAYTVAAVNDYSGDLKADILLRDSLGSYGMWIMNGPVITSGAFVGSAGATYTAY